LKEVGYYGIEVLFRDITCHEREQAKQEDYKEELHSCVVLLEGCVTEAVLKGQK
jgi:hypothetical protein